MQSDEAEAFAVHSTAQLDALGGRNRHRVIRQGVWRNFQPFVPKLANLLARLLKGSPAEEFIADRKSIRKRHRPSVSVQKIGGSRQRGRRFSKNMMQPRSGLRMCSSARGRGLIV